METIEFLQYAPLSDEPHDTTIVCPGWESLSSERPTKVIMDFHKLAPVFQHLFVTTGPTFYSPYMILKRDVLLNYAPDLTHPDEDDLTLTTPIQLNSRRSFTSPWWHRSEEPGEYVTPFTELGNTGWVKEYSADSSYGRAIIDRFNDQFGIVFRTTGIVWANPPRNAELHTIVEGWRIEGSVTFVYEGDEE